MYIKEKKKRIYWQWMSWVLERYIFYTKRERDGNKKNKKRDENGEHTLTAGEWMEGKTDPEPAAKPLQPGHCTK